jgi:hypothetical protein
VTHPKTSATKEVQAFFASLRHPSKREFLTLRRIILGADPHITEHIKWKVPSFRTSEFFATLHLRAKDGVQVILHLGAKARGKSATGVADPASLLEWLAKDRALARFRDMSDIGAKRGAFTKLLRQWIKHL